MSTGTSRGTRTGTRTGTGTARAGAGRCLLWLTAATTASLTLTGCHLSDGMSPAAAAQATSVQHSVRPAAARRHGMAPPAVPASVPQLGPSPTPMQRPRASLLVISDGSDVVQVGAQSVRFPTPVTDAVVSPNGQVVGFVDGLGNIATARLDGTDVRVLTSADPQVRRAQPTFEDGGSEIVFSERGHDGVWRLKEVAADGHDGLTDGQADPTVAETAMNHGDDTAPSAAWFQGSHTDPARSVLVFEHRTSQGRVQVFLADRNQRGFGSSRLLDGRAPAVSPTGDRVAFIGAAGQVHVQSLVGDRPRPTQVTWGAHPSGNLAWSPDGRRIVFSTAYDIESVSSTPALPGRNPVHVVLARPGVASLGTVSTPVVGTFTSADPVQTALAVSRAHFVDGTTFQADGSGEGINWADHVTLLDVSDRAAAPTAAAIADGQPILFVRNGRLAPQVRDEILRLLQRPHGFGRPGTVDIVGGIAEVPDSIAADLRQAHLRVRRFDPADAATDVASALGGFSSSYVVVSPDDLAAVTSSASAQSESDQNGSAKSPLLLSDGSTMPAATARALNRMARGSGASATVYAVGQEAQAAVRASWPGKRPFQIVDVGGQDAAVGGDSLAAVQGLYDAPGHLSVTTADDWPDQLVASMLGPVLVVGADGSLPASAADWLAASQATVRSVYAFGRSSTLPSALGEALYGGRYTLRSAPADITD